MVQFLQQQGLKQTQIADHPLVGSDRGTVRNILRGEHPLQQSERKKREAESTLISAYIPYIQERLEKYPQLSAVRIHEEMTDMGYTGSIRTTRRGVAALRQPRKKRAYKPFETLPGQQMQVDWATFTIHWPGGAKQTIYAFIAVLGYSRHVYVEYTTSMDMNTFLACHHHAFLHFKGVPQEVVYDNARTVTQERVGSIVRFQQELLAFSKHYGYRPHACWVLDPESKGKVESSVRYVQDNFFYGREFESMHHLNEEAITWCQRVARRVHGTTRKIPYECWKEEQAYLHLLPELPYLSSNMQVRKADKTGLISVEGNRYSVPWMYQNHNVRIVDHGDTFDVYNLEGEWLTAHTKAKEKTKPIILDDHYKDRPHGSLYRKQRSLQTKFEGLGERAKEFAVGLSLEREGGSLRDQMESILRLTEIYPAVEVYEAIKRCCEFRNFTYGAVKRIVETQRRHPKALPSPPNQASIETNRYDTYEQAGIRSASYYEEVE
ncbi:IS21 family transposase [Aneurinibacillus tyrosinisolvens]|uniref:IS21 family transposase n=1 Tax=Aneurinibacillus tyrosinisolvens TaxID=1443435 RepID=UPI00063F82E9|nr:IS21 family transposase [Aneurinibacillus tyrosinisolvens]